MSSWQWRAPTPLTDVKIDDVTDTINRRMYQLENYVDSSLSMTWKWRRIEPCDPCALVANLNRQMHEMTNQLRRNTDSPFAWRTITYEDNLDDLYSRLNRWFRRLQHAVNTASAGATYTLTATNSGSADSADNDLLGNPIYPAWSVLRALTGTKPVVAVEGAAALYAGADEGPSGAWSDIIRGFLAFDTSSVTGTVASGTATIVVEEVYSDIGLEYALYAYTPGVTLPTTSFVDTPAANAFWLDLMSGSSALASDDTFTSDSVSADDSLVFTLNSDGLDHINQSGVTAFLLASVNDFDNSDPGSTANELVDGLYCYAFNDGTTANRPVLSITTS